MFKTRYKSHHDAEHEYRELLPKTPASGAELTEYLNAQRPVSLRENAIYIHVPFCERICSFCNMNRKLVDDSLGTYVTDLIKQIRSMGNHHFFKVNEIKAVYFGGGTPTVLAPEAFEEIMTALRASFLMTQDCEITCETTLHNLTTDHLTMFKVLGINRLSIGIQTFQTAGRKFFNRTYDKAEVIKRLTKIRQSFAGCLSIDKIYNYPGETKEMLLDDVAQIINLEIDSVSFYSLMIHKGSKLSEELTASDFSLEQDQHFHDLFIEALRTKGDFEFLELTKMARTGRDRYYYMNIRNGNGNTIPLGKGAGGQIGPFQIYNVDFDRIMMVRLDDDTNEVANKVYGIFQSPVIEKAQLEELKLVTALQAELEKLIAKGYLVEHEQAFEMTAKGIFYGNNIGGVLARKYLEAQPPKKVQNSKMPLVQKAKIEKTIADFVAPFKGGIMATMAKDKKPQLSTIAVVKKGHTIYTLISQTAPHYHNLKEHNQAQIIFAEEQADMENAFVRKRLSYDVTATFIDGEESLLQDFCEQHGAVTKMLCQMGFEFVALKITGGKIILGPAMAYRFDEDEVVCP